MCFVIADGADSSTAAFALAYLATVLEHDMVRLDPLTAAFADAVDLILSLVFEKLSVPGFLEFLIEQSVNVFEIDMFVCAAARRHVSRVGNGHLEDTSKTSVAHPMLARQEGGPGDGNVVGATC